MTASELYKPQGIEGNQIQFSISRKDEFNRRLILTTQYKSLELPIPQGYGPPRGGLLLTHNLGEVSGKTFCDLGTGFFAINVIAAKLLGAKMSIGLERNFEAVRWSNSLIQSCGLDDTYILCADTFCISQDVKFDVIVGNLPMMPSKKTIQTPEDFYHFGGETGWEVIDSYLSWIPQFLNKGGYIRLLLLDFLGIDKRTSPLVPSAFERLKNIDLEPSIIATHEFNIDEDHPFNRETVLLQYVSQTYPLYNFSSGTYKTVIVQGKSKSTS